MGDSYWGELTNTHSNDDGIELSSKKTGWSGSVGLEQMEKPLLWPMYRDTYAYYIPYEKRLKFPITPDRPITDRNGEPYKRWRGSLDQYSLREAACVLTRSLKQPIYQDTIERIRSSMENKEEVARTRGGSTRSRRGIQRNTVGCSRTFCRIG